MTKNNMDRKELKKQYDELVAGIETARMFDGRNQCVDIYVCEKCGKQFYTRYKDKGVTPFIIRCRHCGNGGMIHENTITEQVANVMGVEVHDWVRPTFKQLQNLSDEAIGHVLNGGLMLEDDLTLLKRIKIMARNKYEQINYLLKHRKGGMSDRIL